MSILLDHYEIPEKGEFEVYVKRKINLRVSAEEARRTVHWWLLDQVSYMMGAEEPELVLHAESVTWRVPVVLTACHVGRVGIVGQVDVNVETGEIDSPSDHKKQILHSGRELADRMPPYQARTTMPPNDTPLSLQTTHSPGRPSGDPFTLLPADARSVRL